jgi:hypothetical protein
MHHAAALAIRQALTSQRRRRVVSWPMAQMSEYSIVTYEREPGHWRAAVSPKVLDRSRAPGKTVHSTVTPDDSASESEAKLAATRLIRENGGAVLAHSGNRTRELPDSDLILLPRVRVPPRSPIKSGTSSIIASLQPLTGKRMGSKFDRQRWQRRSRYDRCIVFSPKS